MKLLKLDRQSLYLFIFFSAGVILMPVFLTPLGANYPDLLQKIAIFSIFAIGFNILFGLTGYLSFGHAAFLGIGSYAAVWCFKLFTMNVFPAILMGMFFAGIFSLAIGYICLRRSGIYFSILTLALAQMSYNLAYSVLTPITNGETGLQLTAEDPRMVDALFIEAEAGGALPTTNFFGMSMSGYTGFYFCAAILIVMFYISVRIFNSPFGLQLRAIKSNQVRMNYSGYSPRPYLLMAFFISGLYAGLAGALLAAVDPLAGAERMQWTASGEVVLMTILGGTGTLLGPALGVGVIEYFENIFSSYSYETLLAYFSFLPDVLARPLSLLLSSFVGEKWHLTLGLLFMVVVIFLPGGIMQGVTAFYNRYLIRYMPKRDE